MYKIKGNGIIWDAKNNKPLVSFFNGEFKTKDENLANKLKDMNYELEIIEDEEINTEENNFEEMDLEELKNYADENNIDLGKSTSKNGIIEKIKLLKE